MSQLPQLYPSHPYLALANHHSMPGTVNNLAELNFLLSQHQQQQQQFQQSDGNSSSPPHVGSKHSLEVDFAGQEVPSPLKKMRSSISNETGPYPIELQTAELLSSLSGKAPQHQQFSTGSSTAPASPPSPFMSTPFMPLIPPKELPYKTYLELIAALNFSQLLNKQQQQQVSSPFLNEQSASLRKFFSSPNAPGQEMFTFPEKSSPLSSSATEGATMNAEAEAMQQLSIEQQTQRLCDAIDLSRRLSPTQTANKETTERVSPSLFYTRFAAGHVPSPSEMTSAHLASAYATVANHQTQQQQLQQQIHQHQQASCNSSASSASSNGTHQKPPFSYIALIAMAIRVSVL